LLDYLIDQEDRINGNLNFFLLQNNDEMIERFQHFIQMQRKAFLNTRFHQLINQALWGLPLKQESEEATGCSGHSKTIDSFGW